jgi:hypothetical protein
MEWGVPPNIVPPRTPTQLLALIVAKQVLDDAARGQFQDMDRERMSVILGVTSAQELLGSMVSRLQRPVWVKALRESGPARERSAGRLRAHLGGVHAVAGVTFPGLLGNVVAGRIANRFDLRRHQLRHRRGLRQHVLGAVHGGERARARPVDLVIAAASTP